MEIWREAINYKWCTLAVTKVCCVQILFQYVDDAISVTAQRYPPTTISSWLGRTATRGPVPRVGISAITLHELVLLLYW